MTLSDSDLRDRAGRIRLACQTVCAEGMAIDTDAGTAPGSAMPCP